MVLRNGRIFNIPVSADNIIDKQVLFGDTNVGKVTKYDKHQGATVYTGIPPFHEVSGISLSSLRQIVIATQDRVNDLQPGPNNTTIRPLRLNQWNYALSNYDLSGDHVQFGIWKESESSTETYFQLIDKPWLHKEYSEVDLKLIELIRLTKQLPNRTEDEILTEFLKSHSI